jgi:hypothetical protein
MANIVRGFRRIGWVLTLPVAALIIMAFFESTKEFSASNYEFQEVLYGGSTDSTLYGSAAGEKVIEIPGIGYADISGDVSDEIASRVIADFYKNQKLIASPLKPGEHRYTAIAPDQTAIYLIGPEGASDDEINRQSRRLSISAPQAGFVLEPGSDRDRG